MATIREIAKIAGVSTATVSRIINGKGEASPETVKRVLKLVAEHNYQPNQLARTLSQRSSNLLAVMLPNLMNPFFGELATAIERHRSTDDPARTLTRAGHEVSECFDEDVVPGC